MQTESQLTPLEKIALELVDVKALQATFKVINESYAKEKTGRLYLDTLFNIENPLGEFIGAICLVPTLFACVAHSLFRRIKKEIRLYGYEGALARNPTSDNAKIILHDFLKKSYGDTEKNTLKSVFFNTYLHLAVNDMTDPERVYGIGVLQTVNNRMDDETSKSRIKEAIKILEPTMNVNTVKFENETNKIFQL